MIRRRSGSIVNISSVWGLDGGACEVAYSASKAGLVGLTKALARELGPSGVRVNAVAPGVIDSPMNPFTPDELRNLAERSPLGRIGKPSDVAAAVLAVADNPFITGEILRVDGYFT